ncbi:MAG: methyltransferase domain-containing protein [Nitrosomonas sp.]|nr:MAG: methyltransferase domain-containing protein [Nitrosomonas sp.]
MLFSKDFKINPDHILIHVHVPRTDAASLRHVFTTAYGAEKYLQNYQAQIDILNAGRLAGYGMIVGHFAYGIHQQLQRKPIYLTTVRNPIDRYISTYAAFLANPNSRLHEIAMESDINSFLREGIDSSFDPYYAQFNNLQCRLICGKADFKTACSFINQKFFLACGHDQVAHMVQLLALNLNLEQLPAQTGSESTENLRLYPEKMQLSEDSVALILEREKEDLLLFHYVERAFAERYAATMAPLITPSSSQPASDAVKSVKTVDSTAFSPASQAGHGNELIPPQELRFMGETEQNFLPLVDELTDIVLKLNDTPPKAILDIGCGYGRIAYGLRRANYQGSYTGFDILVRQIKWLQENFNGRPGQGGYGFHYFNTYNERYNPGGRALQEIVLPFPKASFDCLVTLSVFTHMYEDDLIEHIRYLKAFILPGGQWIASFFIVASDFTLANQPPKSAYPMRKQVSPNSYISDLTEPLRAIAYAESFLHTLLAEEGLEIVKQLPGNWQYRENQNSFQDWLVLRRIAA